MKKCLVYIHGMGGNTEEAKHYEKLFPSYETISFDYKSENPWDAQSEFSSFFEEIENKYDEIILIAVSIGAYFSISSLSNRKIKKAFFISPIVDMKNVIENMMKQENITENELIEKKEIITSNSQVLSNKYYQFAKKQEIKWNAPGIIIYGDRDNFTSCEIMKNFSKKHNMKLYILKNSEHWFHNEIQMKFIDEVIQANTEN